MNIVLVNIHAMSYIRKPYWCNGRRETKQKEPTKLSVTRSWHGSAFQYMTATKAKISSVVELLSKEKYQLTILVMIICLNR